MVVGENVAEVEETEEFRQQELFFPLLCSKKQIKQREREKKIKGLVNCSHRKLNRKWNICLKRSSATRCISNTYSNNIYI